MDNDKLAEVPMPRIGTIERVIADLRKGPWTADACELFANELVPIAELLQVAEEVLAAQPLDRCATPASPDEMKVYDAIAANYRKDAAQSAVWAEYVAGMVVAYLGGGVDDERIKPIAGIIERRLWALAAQPKPEVTADRAALAGDAKRMVFEVYAGQAEFTSLRLHAINFAIDRLAAAPAPAAGMAQDRRDWAWIGASAADNEPTAAPEAPGTQDGEADQIRLAFKHAMSHGPVGGPTSFTFSRHGVMEFARALTSTVNADLRRFLDAAGGEGLVLGGVDAADLFERLRPVAPEAPKPQHVATLQFWSDAPPEVEWEVEPEKLLMQFGNHRVDLFAGAAPEAPGTQDGEALAEAMRLALHILAVGRASFNTSAEIEALRAFLAPRLRPVAPEAPAQPVQGEPVAWLEETADGRSRIVRPGALVSGDAAYGFRRTPLYAAPPARKRVTEAEIDAIAHQWADYDNADRWREKARAVLALAHVGVELEGGVCHADQA